MDGVWLYDMLLMLLQRGYEEEDYGHGVVFVLGVRMGVVFLCNGLARDWYLGTSH